MLLASKTQPWHRLVWDVSRVTYDADTDIGVRTGIQHQPTIPEISIEYLRPGIQDIFIMVLAMLPLTCDMHVELGA